MGRVKLKIKGLENTNGRQATYAKRKNGIMKKANELSILCDIDIVLLMFSPIGKPSLCNGEGRKEGTGKEGRKEGRNGRRSNGEGRKEGIRRLLNITNLSLSANGPPIHFRIGPLKFQSRSWVLEQVVLRVKPNGHTCSTSPVLCCPRARLENSPHVRGRVEKESHIDEMRDLACAYK
ncbi:hypothetical protein DVH24_019542 [Malus domestica]|uniref:MADS-box domain-containing protein n=1 Tax=Malus domestica TaxID=3750 RepID=A0A498I3A2_MALDO|nr:hypothetical protein DVH24_019542 [Malus domestica]